MQNMDLKNYRRFSIFLSFILVTLSLAGLGLDAPAKVSPLGIPLVINRPELLPAGLFVAALYSTVKYFYYAFLVNISPFRARRMLRNGSPVHAPTLAIDLGTFTEHVSDEVARYFPKLGNIEAAYNTSESGGQCRVQVTVPRIVWVLSFFEDLDYALPMIANFAAIACWIFYGF